jgi:carbon monoxide dehydrogenase subunit G
MPSYEISAIINRPVSEVFAFVADFSNASKWMPEVKEMTLASEGPPRAGAKVREVLRAGPKIKGGYQLEITEWTQDRAIAMKGAGPGIKSFAGRYQFEPVEGGTRMTTSVTVKLSVIVRPFGWLLTPKMRGDEWRRFANLKRLLETSPAHA